MRKKGKYITHLRVCASNFKLHTENTDGGQINILEQKERSRTRESLAVPTGYTHTRGVVRSHVRNLRTDINKMLARAGEGGYVISVGSQKWRYRQWHVTSHNVLSCDRRFPFRRVKINIYSRLKSDDTWKKIDIRESYAPRKFVKNQGGLFWERNLFNRILQ